MSGAISIAFLQDSKYVFYSSVAIYYYIAWKTSRDTLCSEDIPVIKVRLQIFFLHCSFLLLTLFKLQKN